ncbi:MAG: hypothetical protein A2Z34_02135 [Planctomycetes bacterium RBG_16_59_8]|nr:MAG: hypothetical protein A2Z34_02135 [Planctomycetes bacterium RBG_16_59_8]
MGPMSDFGKRREMARKLLEREGEHIRTIAERIRQQSGTPREILSGVCELLNARQRYFGQTGEHFSVQDPEGIEIVDTLDEALLISIHLTIDSFRSKQTAEPVADAMKLIEETLKENEKQLPPYPVAFMVMFVIRDIFERVGAAANRQSVVGTEEVEKGIIATVGNIINGYVRNRMTPVMRHFGDVAREYSVVSRLKCPACKVEKYEVALQTLCTDKEGHHYDKVEIKCSECDGTRTIHFALPHFKDIAAV